VKNETLKRVQGDVKMVFRVTLLLLRHTELVSASSYSVMLNLFQHLKVSLSHPVTARWYFRFRSSLSLRTWKPF